MKPRYFTKRVPTDDSTPKTRKSWIKLAGISFVFFLFAIVVAYGGWHISNIAMKITQNWDVIQFSYEKPDIVRTAKEDYLDKTKQLDKSIINKREKEQEKMIEKAVEEYKVSNTVTPTRQP